MTLDCSSHVFRLARRFSSSLWPDEMSFSRPFTLKCKKYLTHANGTQET